MSSSVGILVSQSFEDLCVRIIGWKNEFHSSVLDPKRKRELHFLKVLAQKCWLLKVWKVGNDVPFFPRARWNPLGKWVDGPHGKRTAEEYWKRWPETKPWPACAIFGCCAGALTSSSTMGDKWPREKDKGLIFTVFVSHPKSLTL